MIALAQLLVALNLPGAAPVTVEALLGRDSLLLLPARDVAAFLGTAAPTIEWTTLAILRREWPAVSFTFDARALTVYVSDPLAVLPASRLLQQRVDRASRGAPTVNAGRSGPFLSLTADDLGRSAVDGGFSWKGRAAATIRRTRLGTAWGVSLAPSSHLFASWASERRAAVRVATGPAWVSASWQDGRASADALVMWHQLALFASTRDAFAVTINAAPVGVQAGRTGKRTTLRLTYGPIGPSPFTVPQVP
jgi:hypothetical protein